MPAQPDEIWDAIRGELRRETPDFKFHIWLEPLQLAAIRGHTVYVRAPEHIRTSVAERYLPLLRRAASIGFDEHALVEVVGDDWEPPAEDAPAGSTGTGAAGSETTAPARRGDRLNPKYTFEQFVIGPGNRFAHAAALAVAELPGHSYNPLFLHGSPGIGKTHLLHAIGNYVERFGSGLQVRYATIEEFTSEFVEAVRRNQTGRLQAALPRRGRGADRRRPVPRRPRQDARGVLPHVQLADRRRPAARHDLRPRARGHPGHRGAPDRAVRVGARGRGGHARARGAHGDPRQARPARRHPGGRRRARRDREPRDHQRPRARGRADPRRGVRVDAQRAAHARARPARAAPARRRRDAGRPQRQRDPRGDRPGVRRRRSPT